MYRTWHCCIEGSGGAVTGRLVVGTADRGPDRLEWTVVRHHRGHQPGCAALSTGNLAADPRPDGLMQQCPREELRIAIVTWIERTYHRRRRQEALGRLTPIEYETIMTAPATQAA